MCNYIIFDRRLAVHHRFNFSTEPCNRFIERLASPDNRIDRTEEVAHTVVVFQSTTVEPVYAAVPACNVSVNTCCNVNNDLAMALWRGLFSARSHEVS